MHPINGLRRVVLAACLLLGFTMAGGSLARAELLTLGTTTSIENSGLLEHLLDRFRSDHDDITVRTVVQATGAVLALGRSGDVDILLTHDAAGEEDLVADGVGVERRPVMTSGFLIIGPEGNPAGVSESKTIPAALQRIAVSKSLFVSRGDDSGTHRAERRLWAEAGLSPDPGMDQWYLETGSGMGTTLLVAVARNTYAMTESASWYAFAMRDQHRVFAGLTHRVVNQYALTRLNPDRFPHLAHEAADRFADWLTGPAGRAAIGGFEINGTAPFAPIGLPRP